MGLVLLFGLSDQLEDFIFFLLIEEGSQCSTLAQVGQGHAPLSVLLELELDDCQLARSADPQVEVCEVVVDA